MSLEIVVARDINHAFDIVSIKPMESRSVVQREEIGDFFGVHRKVARGT